MAASGSRSMVPFVLVGLAVALLIGVVFSSFAAESPDALQRAVLDSACQDATSEAEAEECLAEQEGDPVVSSAPAGMADYEITWLSGLVGVITCFVVGSGLVFLLRRTGGSSSGGASSRAR